MHSPPGRGRSEVFRGLAECQAVPSEGSTVLCATEARKGPVRGRGWIIGNSSFTPSVSFALLQSTLWELLWEGKPSVVATDASFASASPCLGGQCLRPKPSVVVIVIASSFLLFYSMNYYYFCKDKKNRHDSSRTYSAAA